MPRRNVKSGGPIGFWQKGKIDITFLSLILILMSVGLICLFSSSYAFALSNYKDSYHFIKKQAIFTVVGIGFMLFLSKVNYHIYRRFAWVVYGATIVMLVVVLLLPPMSEDLNFHRWLYIGSFSFQPSEIAKFSIVLLFAHLISKYYNTQMKDFKFSVLKLGGLLAVFCGLVVVETHLSATLLIFAIGASLMVIGGIKFRYVFGAIGVVVTGAVTAVLTGLVGYGNDRITSWLDPWSDAKGVGWQIIQSLISIGSGGFFGRGLGESRQKYLWVPEPHNDFIFAITCEELGFVGAMIIIGLFIALVWRGYVIASRAPDKFGALMAIGLTLQVGFQAALNIMVVTNTIPNTGISLPFFSYGGTALVMLLAQMGIVLSISRASSVTKV
ncbi:MAG: cell division protein FtsW [Clostridia bacterium]|nr:cell division protein FtsW [Clostridia bacterium]